MNIYVAIENPFSKTTNPYVSTLINSISKNHMDVYWGYGINKFWSTEIEHFDVIFVHWPEKLLLGKYNNHNSDELDVRIKELKRKGLKFVTTCHNLVPHYCKVQERIKTYSICYKYSDLIFHLGNYSKNKFENIYHDAKHVILYHHVYDDIYKIFPTRYDAIQRLNLNENKRYILCFGAFRDKEERTLIKKIHNDLYRDNIEFLLPSFIKIPQRRNKIYAIKALINFYYTKVRYKGLHLQKTFIDDNLLPYYYAAADIALIHRTKILNSGNVPLGFLMKKVVVGPDTGNVGELLNSTGNPTFKIQDLNSIIPAIYEGLALNESQKGINNYEYAMTHLRTEIIAEMLYEHLLDLGKL